jgi:signal transduction histidine kinase
MNGTKATVSITRRLIVTVLSLEIIAAIALVGAITVHERHLQFTAFDASLSGTAESLMGAVQDAEDSGDNVMLDMRSVRLPKGSVFLVQEETGRVLGSEGQLPNAVRDSASDKLDDKVHGRPYRFVILQGVRIIDPGNANKGTAHSVRVIYGMPTKRIWHEVLEAIRFFVVATLILLGVTALLLVWVIRRDLQPIHDLAHEAERITGADWNFSAPESARQTKELRPLADALEAALSRLQQSFAQQKRFTADAAHELKTDVAIVKSSLQLLSMRMRTAEEYKAGLARGLGDLTRLEKTVQKLLTLARLEQPDDGRSRDCSLRSALEEAMHQSKSYADLRLIHIDAILEDDAVVSLDREDAVLLCSNLLVNAIQHSTSGSAVEIALVEENTVARLSIRDHGEGISEADRQYLFDPFYRGDLSRSRKSGGTGLGLSICRAICHRIGGSIDIENHPAGGALVTVILPSHLQHGTTVVSNDVSA